MKILYVHVEQDAENAATYRLSELRKHLPKHTDVVFFELQQSRFWKKYPLFSNILATLSPLPRTITKYLMSKGNLTRFKKLIASTNPDSIHFDTMPSVGLSFFTKKPAVFHIHDCQFKQLQSRLDAYHGFLRFDALMQLIKIWLFEKLFFLRASKIIVDTSTDSEFYSSSKSSVIPIGLSDEYLTPSIKNTKLEPTLRLLFTGSLNSKQTFHAVEDFVQNIIPLLDSAKIAFTLDIVGSGDNSNYPIHSSINYKGYVEDLLSEYKSADVFISNISMGSGMKTRILQAIASGVVVLGTVESFDGIDDKYSELYSIYNQPSDIAGLLMALKSGSFSRDGNLLKDFCARYSYENISTNICQLHCDL